VLTGCRRDEVALMTWSELNLDAGTWTIPANRSKNKIAHMVPLPRQAVALIRSLPRRGPQRYEGRTRPALCEKTGAVAGGDGATEIWSSFGILIRPNTARLCGVSSTSNLQPKPSSLS
jgi:integrase